MTSRGRGGSTSDWDPMRDDFNDTSYNAMYPDEDASEVFQLDYNKLYITKLPVALGEDGFVDLFSKYGRVVHSYFSKDTLKRYAFVTFETTGEARIAMMKLNKTEPFGMNICFAKIRNNQSNAERSLSNTGRQSNRHSTTYRQGSIKEKQSAVDRRQSNMDNQKYDQKTMDDNASSKGKTRNVEDCATNGDEGDEGTEAASDGVHDAKLEYDLEKLKLQRLQIMDQQLQVQQRMLIQQQRIKSNPNSVPKRRLLPDGRSIQVTQDNETSFTAGAGDSRNIPGLQREPARRCVCCGAAARLYCAGCRVTPYCAERCQRRDWDARHRSVCHNLASIPATGPMRRSHSPAKNAPGNDVASDMIPAVKCNANQLKGNQASIVLNGNRTQEDVQRRNQEATYRHNRSGSDISNSNRGSKGDDVDGERMKSANSTRRFPQNLRAPLRQPAKVKSVNAEADTVGARGKNQPMQPVPPQLNICDANGEAPRKPLVPTSYVAEKLAAGVTFVASVVARAAECATKQPGFACLTLHEDYGEAYNQLCVEFAVACQNDSEIYTPRIGEIFAFLREKDEGWYRARCLSPTRGALIDSGCVVSLSPSACRRLPTDYATVPEFMAVLNTKELKVGGNLNCTIISSSPSGVKVNVEDDSGLTIKGVEVTRWLPQVDYPKQEPIFKQPETKVEQQLIVQNKPRDTQKPAVVSRPAITQNDTPQAVRETQMQLTPANYVVERLSVNATFLAEAICLAVDGGSSQPGYICLTLQEEYGEAYNSICDELSEACQRDDREYKPRIGETFAYFCEEEGWYRARCLARTRCALIDSGRVVSIAPSACRRLPSVFATVPEFVAVFNTKNMQIGANLICNVVSTSSSGVKVNVTDDTDACKVVEVTRWMPDVEYTAATTTPKPASVPAVVVLSVPRPSVEHNSVYVLLDVTSLHRACVRPVEPGACALFDSALQDTAQYALTAKPLREPPQKGDTVIAKYIDDGNYRALIKRINVAKNKYLIEYIEYGNEEIVTLERLYACPPNLALDAKPAQASIVKLSEREPAALTQAAKTFIDVLKDNATELILTIPGSEKSAPSGSLVNLHIAKNCQPASKKIEDLCTPDWKRLAERGGDVLEMESRFFGDLEYTAVPTTRPFTIHVTYCNVHTLAYGAVDGYEKGDVHANVVFGELTDQITEYCESSLCLEPYLPKLEETCITKYERVNKWVRSVLLELPNGPGSRAAKVLNLDYGDLSLVPTASIRKMMPEFVDKYPLLTNHFEIKYFPETVSRAQLERGLQLMKINTDGVGELNVVSCRELEDKSYEIEVPELIAAITTL